MESELVNNNLMLFTFLNPLKEKNLMKLLKLNLQLKYLKKLYSDNKEISLLGLNSGDICVLMVKNLMMMNGWPPLIVLLKNNLL